MTAEHEGTDEELHEMVVDALAVGDVARRYARLYGADPNTVLAAVEAVLGILRADVAEGSQLSVERRTDADTLRGIGCPACGTILNAKVADCEHPWHADNRPCCVDFAQGPDAHGTVLHTLGCANRCAVEATWYPSSAPLSGRPYPCGTTVGHEGDHWAPPPLRIPPPADGSVSVPPPVDAKLIIEAVKRFGVTEYDLSNIAEERTVRALFAAGVAEGRRQAAQAISEETATFCMDGVGRHLVEVCTKLAAGSNSHG